MVCLCAHGGEGMPVTHAGEGGLLPVCPCDRMREGASDPTRPARVIVVNRTSPNPRFRIYVMCLSLSGSGWPGWAPERSNRLRRTPKHFGRLGVDSVTQGRRREHATSPLPSKSSILGFGALSATTSNAACYWPLDGGVRVEYDRNIFFLP